MVKKYRQNKFLSYILAGHNVTQAAAACGVTEKTGYRWLHERRDELCQRQDTALSAATGQLAAAVTDAVTLLRNVMGDAGLPASARVRAAIGVLDAALRYVELHDILRRIAALEQIYRERSEEGCPAWSVELQSWRE